MIVYDDHRTLFSILFELRKNNLIGGRPNLIYFDYHDDCIATDTPTIEERLGHLGNIPFDQMESPMVWSYGEFTLSTNDDDWLTAAMDLDLVGDAVVVGVERDQNIVSLNARYEHAEIRHHLYKLEHLHTATGNRGQLEDMIHADEEHQYLRRLFAYKTDPENCPFVLDFDLDCFSTECCGKTMAWPEDIFCERYVKNERVKHLMDSLINRASLITICREPDYCGGLGESHKILTYLDRYYFGGQLNTQPIK